MLPLSLYRKDYAEDEQKRLYLPLRGYQGKIKAVPVNAIKNDFLFQDHDHVFCIGLLMSYIVIIPYFQWVIMWKSLK